MSLSVSLSVSQSLGLEEAEAEAQEARFYEQSERQKRDEIKLISSKSQISSPAGQTCVLS